MHDNKLEIFGLSSNLSTILNAIDKLNIVAQSYRFKPDGRLIYALNLNFLVNMFFS